MMMQETQRKGGKRTGRGSGWRSRPVAQLRGFLHHDAGPWAQFFKYGISGVTASCVHIFLFFLLGWRLFPALTSDDWMVRLLNVTPGEVLDEGQRAWHAAICTTLAFLVSNAVAYVLNILFVFKKGRHHWVLEIGMFYAVSAVALVIGTGLQSWLIVQYGVMTTLAFGMNTFSALLINYTMRRYVIFHR